MSTTNDPGGVTPAETPAGEDPTDRYREAITEMIKEALSRRELGYAANALACGFAQVVYGCNSLAVAADMMRITGNRLLELSSEPDATAVAESRPEGATLQ